MKDVKGAMALLVVMMLVMVPNGSESAVTCSEVLKNLRPCVNYLVSGSGSGKPPPACCAGASALASSASTTGDKRKACECIKSAATQINPKPQLAKSLASDCGITLPFAVSPNVDCSSIN